MKLVADLHLHSKYSRAVSQKMDIAHITDWAIKKGINLVATSDWTHPVWLSQLKANLTPSFPGLFKPKNNPQAPVDFLLSTELSSIYNQDNQVRRIHLLVFAPSFETVDKINAKLLSLGANLGSDGRPILGLSAITLSRLIFDIDPNCLIIPAHIWTPWFSLYGSKSGFDSLNQCFGQFSKYIYAIETGLSSDPLMNWQIKELDNRAILSFSDAHSPSKLAREATVFDLPQSPSFSLVSKAIKSGFNLPPKTNSSPHINYTIEFYPEEGKYHYTGHRNCQISQSPSQTKKKGKICPVCTRPLTVGVAQRVADLSGRALQDISLKKATIGSNIKAISYNNRPPFVKLVPLQEILAQCLDVSPNTKQVFSQYQKLINNFENELNLLINVKIDDIKSLSGPKIAQAIKKVRQQDIYIKPGFDGQFGTVKIWPEQKEERQPSQDQMSLF